MRSSLRHSFLVSFLTVGFGAFCCGTTVSAAPDLTAVGFVQPSGKLFLQIPEVDPDPNETSEWLLIDDVNGGCKRINSAWARRANQQGGIALSDYHGDRVYFIYQSGQIFWRTQAGTTWEALEPGSWLKETMWLQHQPSADPRKLAWIGNNGTIFLNDPRSGFENLWYQVGPVRHLCHVFTESGRQHGPSQVQTVTLSSGLAGVQGWLISTGFSSIGPLEIEGNWLE